jgi:hypothetical protein
LSLPLLPLLLSYAWSLQLADLVASERSKLHELFPRGRYTAPGAAESLLERPFSLEQLMDCMRRSATELLGVAEYPLWEDIMQRASKKMRKAFLS